MDKDKTIKILVVVLILVSAFGAYHIFVQMPKMMKDCNGTN